MLLYGTWKGLFFKNHLLLDIKDPKKIQDFILKNSRKFDSMTLTVDESIHSRLLTQLLETIKDYRIINLYISASANIIIDSSEDKAYLSQIYEVKKKNVLSLEKIGYTLKAFTRYRLDETTFFNAVKQVKHLFDFSEESLINYKLLEKKYKPIEFDLIDFYTANLATYITGRNTT